MSVPITFWGLFLALLAILLGYVLWVWLAERSEGDGRGGGDG